MACGRREQYSLQWNGFETNIATDLYHSMIRADFVDATLAVDGHQIKVHRLVLSVCSPYFQEMFKNMPPTHHAFGKV